MARLVRLARPASGRTLLACGWVRRVRPGHRGVAAMDWKPLPQFDLWLGCLVTPLAISPWVTLWLPPARWVSWPGGAFATSSQNSAVWGGPREFCGGSGSQDRQIDATFSHFLVDKAKQPSFVKKWLGRRRLHGGGVPIQGAPPTKGDIDGNPTTTQPHPVHGRQPKHPHPDHGRRPSQQMSPPRRWKTTKVNRR